MNRRRDDAGRQDGVSEVKECIGAAIKATIEGETETTQDIELIRGFHSEAFCYRGSPEATRCGCFLPVQLEHKLSYRGGAIYYPRSGGREDCYRELPRILLLGSRVNKPPVNAPDPSG